MFEWRFPSPMIKMMCSRLDYILLEFVNLYMVMADWQEYAQLTVRKKRICNDKKTKAERERAPFSKK